MNIEELINSKAFNLWESQLNTEIQSADQIEFEEFEELSRDSCEMF